MVGEHKSESRTEDLVRDLLDIQSWDFRKPPKGQVIRKNEYKDYQHLSDIFKGKSKTGSGDAYPDFLIVSENLIPQMVIEAKADESDLDKAIAEAKIYATACLDYDHPTLAVGIAGQEKSGIAVSVQKYTTSGWKSIMYGEKPVSWIPTKKDLSVLISTPRLLDLTPIVPRPEILAKKADMINRILRESNVKDEYRPAYVGATILALWRSKGEIRRSPEFVLKDINLSCKDAFTNAGKAELAKSLHIDEANATLASSMWQIIAELEKLNIMITSFDHDYLGQLYETFFRYTGGNTIGQYFTPRHITRFMADVCQTTEDSLVIDPACGTGGFLIAAIQRAVELSNLNYQQSVDLVRNKLIGYESEPITAALCVANMILRGDGKTGVRKDDCFKARDFPDNCDVALMNPPFPHKKTDTPPQQFIERALDGLHKNGKLGVIVPTSFIVKKNYSKWRKSILEKNTLVAVCENPDELFQPFSSSTTSILFFEKGVPHNSKLESAFVRIEYDGLTLKKGTRVNRPDGKNQLPLAADSILNKKINPGFSGAAKIVKGDEWAPGAYIPASKIDDDILKNDIDELLRRLNSFYIRYAKEIANQRQKISDGDLTTKPYREMISKKRISNSKKIPALKKTIGGTFDLFYGQKELHSRENLPPGDSLIISPTEQYNGCYGWHDFSSLITPPFITVAQTGTIGEAFVQCEPCAVNDDCLILLPKQENKTALSDLFIAAAIVRHEKWRFNYGRKLTPNRISNFPFYKSKELTTWIDDKIKNWNKIASDSTNLYAQK